MAEKPLINEKKMDKPIKLGEFIMSFLLFVGVVCSAYASIKSDISNGSVRLNTLEQNYQKLEQKIDKGNERVVDKLDIITRELSKKQDRRGG